MDNSELLHMLEVPESLKSKVEEAVTVLRDHQVKEQDQVGLPLPLPFVIASVALSTLSFKFSLHSSSQTTSTVLPSVPLAPIEA